MFCCRLVWPTEVSSLTGKRPLCPIAGSEPSVPSLPAQRLPLRVTGRLTVSCSLLLRREGIFASNWKCPIEREFLFGAVWWLHWCQLFFWGSCVVRGQSEIPQSASLESFTEVANSYWCVLHRPRPLLLELQCAYKLPGEFDEVPILAW